MTSPAPVDLTGSLTERCESHEKIRAVHDKQTEAGRQGHASPEPPAAFRVAAVTVP